jgi:hypothetical protein
VGLPYTCVLSLAVRDTNLFAGTGGGGVFLSTNSGTSWTEVNTGMPKDEYGNYRSVRCFAVSGTNLLVGTNGGIFLTTNNGTSWTGVNSGLSDSVANSLIVSGANLYAGTVNGVWRRPLSEMITSVHQSTNVLPKELKLDQNYPNPFNPSTTIKFELPRASHVSLTVYDILGRQVSVLVNERKEAGDHEVKFDGSGLACGVYLYRLQTGDVVQSRRMLVLK